MLIEVELRGVAETEDRIAEVVRVIDVALNDGRVICQLCGRHFGGQDCPNCYEHEPTPRFQARVTAKGPS